MSGQRVHSADSSAVWLTTRSQRREAHLKAEVVTKVLNVFSSQTFTQRENQKLFSFTLADAVETTSVEADDDHEKRSHVLQVGAFLLPRTNDLWDFTHDLKNWNVCFCCFFALSHARFHLPNKLPKRSFHTFSSYILPVPVGWCYHVVIKR